MCNKPVVVSACGVVAGVMCYNVESFGPRQTLSPTSAGPRRILIISEMIRGGKGLTHSLRCNPFTNTNTNEDQGVALSRETHSTSSNTQSALQLGAGLSQAGR